MFETLLLSVHLMSSFENVTLTRVIDGDTFVVQLPFEEEIFGKDVPIRIKGIDSPELKSKVACERKLSLKAKEKVQVLLESGPMDLNFCERDKFWRLLCTVRVHPSTDVGSYLMDEKLARPYDGGEKLKWGCK